MRFRITETESTGDLRYYIEGKRVSIRDFESKREKLENLGYTFKVHKNEVTKIISRYEFTLSEH